MLALLALEGLKLLELVDWHTWTGSERKRLLKDIDWLIQVDPPESEKASERALRGSGADVGRSLQVKRSKEPLRIAEKAPRSQKQKSSR
jgi:hypothetical protein